MILGTTRTESTTHPDGQLVILNATRSHYVNASLVGIQSLRQALLNWKHSENELRELSGKLDRGLIPGAVPVRLEDFVAPLPMASGFYDASAFLSHVKRARRSRGDEMPESAKVTPLMYQGVSDGCLPWNSPIQLLSLEYGGDFEAELAAIMADTPAEISPEAAPNSIALFTLFNDITFRELVKKELPTSFGFLQSKPNSSFAPFVVTPDELGSAWDGKRILGTMKVRLNGKLFGEPKSQEMHFSFGQLIAHAAKTRPLSGGSIVGTGTISNDDASKGFCCLTEKRFQEILDSGKAVTPWLQPGDKVEIEFQTGGSNPFGPIVQSAVLH